MSFSRELGTDCVQLDVNSATVPVRVPYEVKATQLLRVDFDVDQTVTQWDVFEDYDY